MIAKGTTHNNGARLAAYMETSKDGERAELWELRGFATTNIKDAFRCVDAMAGATKCEQPFFHVQVRNREGEIMTRQQFEYAADRIERMLGLTGQPRAITFHTYEHNNDQHMHVAWSRIDQDTLTAKPLPFFKERLKKISRELELHFGLEPVTNRREGHIKYAPKRAEHEQARRLGLDAHELRNTIRDCWDHSDNGRSFQAALEHEGMTLALGERRDFVVIDQRGGTHVLSKRILDVTATKIRARLSDLSRDELPSVEMARALLPEKEQERKSEKTQRIEKLEPVWDRDRADRTWQDAVVNAAIDKEKTERNFVEPEQRREGAGGREEEKVKEREREAEQQAMPDRRGKKPKGVPGRVWDAWVQSDSSKAFATALDEKGIMFARVTKEEAERLYREAAFAKEIGRNAQRFNEGELVIVNEPRLEYHRDGEWVGPNRFQKIDPELASKFLKHLGKRVTVQGIDATLEASDTRADRRAFDREVDRFAHATDIRDFSRKFANDNVKRTLKFGKAAGRTIGKTLEVVSDAFSSLFDPKLTPKQIHEAEKSSRRREAETEATIDFQKYTAEVAYQRRRQEVELEAARQRERERGGRER